MSFRFKEPAGRMDPGRDLEEMRGIGSHTSDPKLADSRVFIGNIDNDKASREDLEERFSKFGKVTGVSIHRGFAFVQYDCEEHAQEAVKSEHGSLLKGTRIDVNLASERGRRQLPFGRGRRPSPTRDKPFGDRGRDFGFGREDMPPGRERSPLRGGFDDRFPDRFKKEDSSFPRRDELGRKDAFRPPYFDDPYRDKFMGPDTRSRFESEGNFKSRYDPTDDQFKLRPFNYPTTPYKDYYKNEGVPKPNECEIIVVNKLQRGYAESVEQRMKNLGIQVDLLFLKDEALLAQTIDDIARRGSLYAVVVSPQNESHVSVTLNILYGTPQEHRNMPLDDALKLVARNFHDHIRNQRENMEREKTERAPYKGTVPADREIQFLLRMLADGRFVAVAEIERVIRYLQERRDKMNSPQGDIAPNAGPSIPSDPKVAPPNKLKEEPAATQQQQQDLQHRIMNIINQGAPPTGASSPAGVGKNLGGVPMNQPGMGPNQQPPTSTYINFDNPSVQKALDNLMQSGPSLLKNISMSGSNVPASQGMQANPQMKPPSAALGGNINSQGGAGGMGDPSSGMGQEWGLPPGGGMGPPQAPGMGHHQGSNIGMNPMSGMGHNQGPQQYPGGPGQQGMFGSGSNMMGSLPRHPLMGAQVGNPGSMLGGGGGGPRRY